MYKAEKVTFLRGSRSGIILLALLFVIPALAAFFTDHNARSEWEKRQLATWSSVQEAESAKQLFSSIDDYLNDHVGFALELNRFYRQFQYYLLGDSPIPNVDIGKDDFLFLNAHSIDNPYSAVRNLCIPQPLQVDKTQNSIEQLVGVLAELQINMTFAVVPSKLLIYPNRLPKTVPQHLREACRQLGPEDSLPGQLMKRALATSYRMYYPIEPMIALRDGEAFYPPQNFHPNSTINHMFGLGLLRDMGIEPGTSYSDGAQLTKIESDLTMLGFTVEVTAWDYPYLAYHVKKQHKRPKWVVKYYAQARDFNTYRAVNPKSERTAVLISNSFGAYIAPHLAPGFRALYHVNINSLTKEEARRFFEELLSRIQPSDFIFLVHDGGLPSPGLEMLAREIIIQR